MPDSIKDGVGTGYLARVDSDNQLFTRATQISHIGHHSDVDSTAFVIGLHHTTQVADTTETVGYITYTGTNSLVISYIVFSTEEDSSTNTGYTKFGIWRNPTVASGTARTEHNLNFSASSTLTADIYDNADGAVAVTMTSGDSVGTVRMKGTSTLMYDYKDAIILGYGNTIGFKVVTDTASKKVRVHVFCYEHSE